MKKIYKYEVPTRDKFSLNLPVNCEILSLQIDKVSNDPVIWVLFDFNEESEIKTEERFFELFGTGHTIHEDMGIDRKYINTYQLDLLNGVFVGHLFERL